MKILIVDDDVNICELIRLYLEKEGYESACAHNGVKAMQIFDEERPDLIILDLMMPGADGHKICKNIRTISNVPIIMLTAKDELTDKISGFSAGADDYITKPFEMSELMMRIKAILRRSGEEQKTQASGVELEGLSINLSNYTLSVGGNLIDTPPKELELLYFLASNPNTVFTRDELLDKLWGYDYYGDTRTVDVHINRIREKIDGASDKWELATVWGVGYKFLVKDASKL